MELSHLHTKLTADNADFKSAMLGSIGLVDRFGNKLTSTAEKAENAAAREKMAFERVRKAVDPAYQALTRYTRAKKLLDSQLKAGNLSVQEHARLVTLTGQKYQVAEDRLENFNTQVRASRFAAGNLFAQFQDIGVMMASGQSPFLLAIQQGSQINQVLLGMSEKGKVLATLSAAFKSFINPIQLVTIGLIAGTAALGQWAISAFSAEEGTNSFKEAIAEAKERTTELKLELEQVRRGFQSIVETKLVLALEQAVEKAAEIRTEINATRGAYGALANQEGRKRLEQAEAEVAAASAALKEYRDTRTELAWAKIEAEGFATAMGSVDIASVAASAGTLATNMAAAAGNAWSYVKAMAERMAAEERLQELAFENSPGGRRLNQYGGRTTTDDREPEIYNPTTGEFESIYPEEVKSPRGRGGGGLARTDEQFEKDLEKLEEQLSTEIELEQEKLREREALIREAYDRGLIDKQKHDELMLDAQKQFNDKMDKLEKERINAALDGWAGMFGDLSSLMASRNKQLFKIGKAAAIAEAVVNGYKAAVSAWDKGMAIGGPPVAAAFTAASLAKTGMLISNIMAQQYSGASRSGPSGGGGGGGVPAVPGDAGSVQAGERGVQRPAVSLTLIGDNFSRGQVVQIAEALNDSGDDGTQLIDIRGRR